MSNGPQYPQYPGEDEPDPQVQSPAGEQVPPPPPPPPSSPSPPPPGTPYGQQPNLGHAPAAPPPGPHRRTNPKATWALILGILGMVLCCLFAGIPAIVLGHQARTEIDAAPAAEEGRGMATAGFVLGIISTVASVLYIAFMIVVVSTNGFGEGL